MQRRKQTQNPEKFIMQEECFKTGDACALKCDY